MNAVKLTSNVSADLCRRGKRYSNFERAPHVAEVLARPDHCSVAKWHGFHASIGRRATTRSCEESRTAGDGAAKAGVHRPLFEGTRTFARAKRASGEVSPTIRFTPLPFRFMPLTLAQMPRTVGKAPPPLGKARLAVRFMPLTLGLTPLALGLVSGAYSHHVPDSYAKVVDF